MPRLRAFAEVAEELMAEGLIERQEVNGEASYRLTKRGLQEATQSLRERPAARVFLAHSGPPMSPLEAGIWGEIADLAGRGEGLK
jgi:Mn-dependent DtxR family transcriptional regulator